ncbi:MAG: Clp protease [Pseudonocardiales bacterium]|nr:Clp protease [Pseudonocardiales bacterium]
MFERFTKSARETVTHAQQEARDRKHGHIGTEHLLVALFNVPHGVAAEVLDELGVTKADIDADIERAVGACPGLSDRDSEALRTIGINLDEVRRQIEDVFGPGALDRGSDRHRRRRGSREKGGPGRMPFTPRSKKALELSLRQAINIGDNYIGTEHLLLGLLTASDSLACELLNARGVTLEAAKTAITGRQRGAAGA